MIIDLVYKKNELELSYIDSARKLQIDKIPVTDINASGKYMNWRTTNIPNELPVKNWDDKFVEQYAADKLNQYEYIKFMKGLPQEQFDTYHAAFAPKCIACDFEMEIQEGFPNAVDEIIKVDGKEVIKKGGQTPIISSAFVNEDYTSLVFTLDPITKEQCEEVAAIVQEHIGPILNKELKTVVIYTPDEYTLLHQTCKAIKEADMLTGWNFKDYDIPFLEARLKKYNLDMSITSKTSSVKWDGLPNHKFINDYLDLYKTYSRWSTPNLISHRLDVVAEALLGIGKLDYKGMTLKELRTKDLPRFLAYNVIDSILVQMIHQKVASVNPVYMLAVESWLSLQECRGPVAHSGAVMAQFFLERFPEKVIAVQHEKPVVYKFPGGFVKAPHKGFGRNVGCLDYSSLYPSLMRSHNLSPSNYVSTPFKFDAGAYYTALSKFVDMPKKQDVCHSMMLDFHGYLVESVNCATSPQEFVMICVSNCMSFFSLTKESATSIIRQLLTLLKVDIVAHTNAVNDPELTVASYGGIYKNDIDYEYKSVQSGLYTRRKEYQYAQYQTTQQIADKIWEFATKNPDSIWFGY